ncbi:hypothetical protein [uncultured Alistipes sp.]|uniref:hypothetical protein n=1 Tax=uncultured Alistipes sp. TaxID=538949 RepID=UPI0025B05F63|nr:hypothetical protein [uncultured Alistipes sp.]
MRSIEKNKRKQKSSNLPLGIGSSWTTWVLVGAVALGFYTWGEGFLWVILGFAFCRNILLGILRVLVSLVALIGFFYFLITRIF